MVTVIERRDGAKTTNCGNCDSTLRYMPSEIFTEKRNYDYTGSYDVVRVITCPACKLNTVIK